MKKNKGFTLVELLAVIVILAVIALIATPVVLQMIETSRKGAAESSMLSYVDATEKTIVTKLMNSTSSLNYDQTYSVNGLILTSTAKKCLDATSKNPVDPADGNACDGTTEIANPNYVSIKVELKGDQPVAAENTTLKVVDNVVTEAKLKFGKYRVSYYYDKDNGKTKYCSTSGDSYLAEADCNAD